MNWENGRPLNWGNPYPNPETTVLTEKHLLRAMEAPKSNYEIFEAGADAMLEALKKQGSYLDGNTVIPAHGDFPEIHCPGGTIGWVVFIPE